MKWRRREINKAGSGPTLTKWRMRQKLKFKITTMYVWRQLSGQRVQRHRRSEGSCKGTRGSFVLCLVEGVGADVIATWWRARNSKYDVRVLVVVVQRSGIFGSGAKFKMCDWQQIVCVTWWRHSDLDHAVAHMASHIWQQVNGKWHLTIGEWQVTFDMPNNWCHICWMALVVVVVVCVFGAKLYRDYVIVVVKDFWIKVRWMETPVTKAS